MKELIILRIIFFLLLATVISVQLFLCLKAKKVIVRLIPTIILLILAGFFTYMSSVSTGFDGLGYFGLLLWNIFYFIADVVCWIIFGIIYLIKKAKGSTH